LTSCISPWPCRPVPMTPRSIVSLGGVWANRRRGQIAGAMSDTPAAFRKSRRFIPYFWRTCNMVCSLAPNYHYDEQTVNDVDSRKTGCYGSITVSIEVSGKRRSFMKKASSIVFSLAVFLSVLGASASDTSWLEAQQNALQSQ